MTAKKGESLKVMVLSGWGIAIPHIAADCADALTSLGHRAYSHDVLPESKDKIISSIMSVIEGLKPDFILSLDAGIVRDFPELFAAAGIHVAAWFVDNPAFCSEEIARMRNTSAFVWDREYMPLLNSMGFHAVEHLPLATNPLSMKRLPPDNPACSPFACDVSFVGSSLTDRSMLKILDSIPQPDGKILLDSVKKVISGDRRRLDDIMRSVEEELGVSFQHTERSLALGQLEIEADILIRSSAVNRLRAMSPHVYGDAGWKELLQEGPVFKGPIDYRKELNLLYSASKINLNVSKFQLLTSVNQRVFDAPACGGFVLTDYRRDVFDLFDTDKEIAVYDSMDDLEQKAIYFLENEEERSARARNTRKRVLSDHTYVKRMKRMVTVVEEFL